MGGGDQVVALKNSVSLSHLTNTPTGLITGDTITEQEALLKFVQRLASLQPYSTATFDDGVTTTKTTTPTDICENISCVDCEHNTNTISNHSNSSSSCTNSNSIKYNNNNNNNNNINYNNNNSRCSCSNSNSHSSSNNNNNDNNLNNNNNRYCVGSKDNAIQFGSEPSTTTTNIGNSGSSSSVTTSWHSTESYQKPQQQQQQSRIVVGSHKWYDSGNDSNQVTLNSDSNNVDCDLFDLNMGSNVSRHSGKGLNGRRTQSSGDLCNENQQPTSNGSSHYGGCGGGVGGIGTPTKKGKIGENGKSTAIYGHINPIEENRAAAESCGVNVTQTSMAASNLMMVGGGPLCVSKKDRNKFCGSLPNHLDVDDTYEEDENKPDIQMKLPINRPGNVDMGCDQGYGSERSPEDELPPSLPLMALSYQQQQQQQQQMQQQQQHMQLQLQQEQQHQQQQIPLSYDKQSGYEYSFITQDCCFAVQVTKGPRGLGLSVSGGIDSNAAFPGLIRIKRLFPHQAAWCTGLLQPGDILLEANEIALTGLTNYEALEVLRTLPNLVTLVVCRPRDEQYRKLSPPTEPPKPPLRTNPNNLHSSNSSLLCPMQPYFTGEYEIIMVKQQGSLGFTLRKEDESVLGHYVRALVREPATTDGRIRPGDKILAVNDVPLCPMTHEEAVIFLRQAAPTVKLRLYRDHAQTPIGAMSPTHSENKSICDSIKQKVCLRPEAINLLSDIAYRNRKQQQQTGCPDSSSSSMRSNATSPRRLRRCHKPSSSGSGSNTISSETNKTDFEIASNAYELNNLDNEALDAPMYSGKIHSNIGQQQHAGGGGVDASSGGNQDFTSLPCETFLVACRTEKDIANGIGGNAGSVGIGSGLDNFVHKNPMYQSAHVQHSISCDGSNGNEEVNKDVMAKNLLKWKGVMLSSDEEHESPEADSSSIATTITNPSVEAMTNEATTELTGSGIGVDGVTLSSAIATIAVANDPQRKIVTVELNRGWNSRLGFSLQCGSSKLNETFCIADGGSAASADIGITAPGTFISAIYNDSVAARDGRLSVGDQILMVNDEAVDKMTTNEIIELLRIIRGPISVTVLRIIDNSTNVANEANEK